MSSLLNPYPRPLSTPPPISLLVSLHGLERGCGKPQTPSPPLHSASSLRSSHLPPLPILPSTPTFPLLPSFSFSTPSPISLNLVSLHGLERARGDPQIPPHPFLVRLLPLPLSLSNPPPASLLVSLHGLERRGGEPQIPQLYGRRVVVLARQHQLGGHLRVPGEHFTLHLTAEGHTDIRYREIESSVSKFLYLGGKCPMVNNIPFSPIF